MKMPPNRPIDNPDFDQILTRALREHNEPVPPDFTCKVLARIDQKCQRAVLARVVRQERLALAACILPVAAAAVAFLTNASRVAVFLKDIVAILTRRGGDVFGRVPGLAEAVGADWRFYAVLAGVLVLAACSFADLVLGDRLRLA
jgi:hypothetical protein